MVTDPTPTNVKNLDQYGSPPLEWDRAFTGLNAVSGVEAYYFLGTVGPDGKPHSAGVGAMWHNGKMYFVSGPGTQKSRHLSRNPAATISVHVEGLDLVLEGDAQRVTDAAELEEMVRLYRGSGWPVEVEGDALNAPFTAPSGGPPPWHLYRLVYHTVIGVATAPPDGATLWRFGNPA